MPTVDPWDEPRDARLYAGPYSVVAHPPCQRWGRFWHGCPLKPHQFKLGSDAGCFASALTAVRNFGGVLEHPADSHAFRYFGLIPPARHQGWQRADTYGAACYVEQGHYGHAARKPTWLYAVSGDLPELNWSNGSQVIPAYAVERYGYEKADGSIWHARRQRKSLVKISFYCLTMCQSARNVTFSHQGRHEHRKLNVGRNPAPLQSHSPR